MDEVGRTVIVGDCLVESGETTEEEAGASVLMLLSTVAMFG